MTDATKVWKIAAVGGRSRTRTYGPLIKSQLLYQLSYAPIAASSGSGAISKPGPR